MKRLVILDGHAILHRAFHAIPPLTTENGVLINAVFGFTSMLLRVMSDLKPTHLAVVFDRPRPTFRKKLFEGYQKKRPKMDETLIPQIEIVHKVVSALGLSIFELDGFEADDLIGTIAVNVKEIPVTVVTGDRDLLQLVNSHTSVYMPVKGISDSKLFGEKEVEEKYQIKPSQVIDYKAIVGDQSDNYPGVAGVGPKTASTLLTKYHTLDGIYSHLSEISPEGLRKKLETGKASAFLGRQLAAIKTDVPLDFTLEKCKIPQLDTLPVRELFEELQFKSLIPRLNLNSDFSNRKQVMPEAKSRPEKEENGQISLF